MLIRISWLKYLFSIPGLYVLCVLVTNRKWGGIPEALFITAFGYLAGYGVERLVVYLTKRGAERGQK